MPDLLDSIRTFAQLWWQWAHALIPQSAVTLLLLFLVLYWVKRLPAQWRLPIWWLVLLKLVFPVPMEISLPVLPATSEHPQPRIHQAMPAEKVPGLSYGSAGSEMSSIPPTAEMLSFKTSSLERGRTLSFGWVEGLFLLWLIVLLSRLTRSIFHLIFVYRLKNASIPDAGLSELANDLRVTLKIRQTVPVRISLLTHSPMVVGIFRPMIILSPDQQYYSSTELRLLLCHELGHIKHHDHQLNWLLSFLVMLMWWNPAAWYLRFRILEENEFLADDVVLHHSADQGRDYSRLLIDVAERLVERQSYSGTLAFVEASNGLSKRIRRVIMKRQTTNHRSTLISATSFLLIALLLLPLWAFDETKNVPQQTDAGVNLEETIRKLTSYAESFGKDQPFQICYTYITIPFSLDQRMQEMKLDMRDLYFRNIDEVVEENMSWLRREYILFTPTITSIKDVNSNNEVTDEVLIRDGWLNHKIVTPNSIPGQKALVQDVTSSVKEIDTDLWKYNAVLLRWFSEIFLENPDLNYQLQRLADDRFQITGETDKMERTLTFRRYEDGSFLPESHILKSKEYNYVKFIYSDYVMIDGMKVPSMIRRINIPLQEPSMLSTPHQTFYFLSYSTNHPEESTTTP